MSPSKTGFEKFTHCHKLHRNMFSAHVNGPGRSTLAALAWSRLWAWTWQAERDTQVQTDGEKCHGHGGAVLPVRVLDTPRCATHLIIITKNIDSDRKDLWQYWWNVWIFFMKATIGISAGFSLVLRQVSDLLITDCFYRPQKFRLTFWSKTWPGSADFTVARNSSSSSIKTLSTLPFVVKEIKNRRWHNASQTITTTLPLPHWWHTAAMHLTCILHVSNHL